MTKGYSTGGEVTREATELFTRPAKEIHKMYLRGSTEDYAPRKPRFAENEEKFAKGSAPQEASYANGGLVLGRTKDFIKEPDRFRDAQFKKQTEDNFGKAGGESDCAPPAKGKALPVVKPRS